MEKVSNYNPEQSMSAMPEGGSTTDDAGVPTEETTPDYSGEIEKRKLAIKAIERASLEKDDSEVEQLESEIYDLEHQQVVGPAKEQIAEHRQRLAEIELAVKRGELTKGNAGNEEEIEAEVETRERELRRLENIINQKFDEENEVSDAKEQNVIEEWSKQIVGHESKNEQSKSPEQSEQEPESPEQIEQSETIEEIDKIEYVRLKKEFKESQRAYLTALEQDYADRGILKKVLGLGRKEFSPVVQQAYDAFMVANQAYYSLAEQNGHYAKVAERLSRERASETVPNINLLVAGRHILRPAEARLERQRVHLPAYVLEAKNAIQNKIKQNPEIALGVGALLAVLNPAAVITALGVRAAGNKFYVAGKEGQRVIEKNNAIESVTHDEGDAKLAELEAQYFESVRQAHDAKIRTNAAAVGAAVVAGSAYGASGGEQVVIEGGEEPYFEGLSDMPAPEGTAEITPDVARQDELRFGGRSIAERTAPLNITELSPDDVRPYDSRLGYGEVAQGPEVSVGPESIPESIPETGAFETIRTVERGDTLSKIVLETLRERVQTGEVVLPEGINQDRIAHYMYQSFPEMTSAEGIEPRLSPAEWKELGVESGDPHLIRPGEEINVQGLIEKMWGSSISTPPVEDSVSSAVESVVDPVDVPASAESVTLEADTLASEAPEVPATSADIPTASTGVATEAVPVSTGEVEVVERSIPEAGTDLTDSSERLETAAATETVAQNRSDQWLYREAKIAVPNPETMPDVYRPYVSDRLLDTAVVWPPVRNESLHDHLYNTLLQGFRTGHIELPRETVALTLKNETALYGFIEKNLPEVSGSGLSKFFRGINADAFTVEQWQQLGIASGNPRDIALGEEVQTGKIIQTLLERATTASNKV